MRGKRDGGAALPAERRAAPAVGVATAPSTVTHEGDPAVAAVAGPIDGTLPHEGEPRADAVAASSALATVTAAGAPGAACPVRAGEGDFGVELPPRYQLVRELGRGGMGTVVLAHDKVIGREVAIKVLGGANRGGAAAKARLITEARAAAKLDSEHIVRIFDVDADAGLIVMEWVDGEPLDQVLARGPVPRAQWLSIAQDLARGLAAAHERGLIHRDLKPANILLSRAGRAKVADFGVAVAIGSGGAEGYAGTPRYMAPEQRAGARQDARTDVYGLGVVLHELITGALPAATGASAPVLGRRRAGRLAPIVRKCLALDPDARFASASAVARQLTRNERARLGGLVLSIALWAAILWWAAASVRPGATERAHRPRAASAGQRPAAAGTPSEAAVDGLAASRQQGRARVEDSLAAALGRTNAALARNDLAAARAAIEEAINISPSDPEAEYLRLLLHWWSGSPSDDLKRMHALIDVARQPPARQQFLAAILPMFESDFEGAATSFGRALEDFPGDRDLLYGWFEALFHAGYPAQAMGVYRSLRAVDPSFDLGVIHALGYFAARGDPDGIGWLEGLIREVHTDDMDVWRAQLKLARRDHEGALRDLGEIVGRSADKGWSEAVVAVVALYHGQLVAGDAATAAEVRRAWYAHHQQPLDEFESWVIASLRGDPSRDGFAQRLLGRIDNEPSTISRAILSSGYALGRLLQAPDGRQLASLRRWYEARRKLDAGMSVGASVVSLLLADASRDEAYVRSQTASTMPEVAAVARAITAPTATARDSAWRDAAAASQDGQLLPVYAHRRARLAFDAGRDAEVIALCDEAISPRAYSTAFAFVAGPCLALSLRAAERASMGEAARRLAETALSLRDQAAVDDPVIAAARRTLASRSR